MSSHSDRNLLLGILAVQLDFVDKEQLVTAMNAWVIDKSRSLGELLLGQGALDAETHPLLVSLVNKHLERHGNDGQKSLAAISSIGSLVPELSRIGGDDIEATLHAVAEMRSRSAGDSLPTISVGQPSTKGARFQILRPHAKGGLGQVSVARDGELNREVALKEIQANYADDANSRARFVLEAEITGGLEHPGIVPVYGLGQYDDGRPYYAMRFVRGDSLKEAVQRYHADDEIPDAKRNLQIRQLLGRFVDVCQAIEYAHSRGILHRDLKPGNIMLGKYGETLVVDWGLASRLVVVRLKDTATK